MKYKKRVSKGLGRAADGNREDKKEVNKRFTKHPELQFLKFFHFLLLEKDWGGVGVVKDYKVFPLYHLT